MVCQADWLARVVEVAKKEQLEKSINENPTYFSGSLLFAYEFGFAGGDFFGAGGGSW